MEEGEISESSDDVYTPLQRPETKTPKVNLTQPQRITNNLPDDVESESSSGEDSSDNCLKNKKENKKKKRTKRTIMKRVQTESDAIQRAKFKKYNVWTATAEEDSLTDVMREKCDVTQKSRNDRSVENYDYLLVNGRKRRRDGDSDEEMYPAIKRGRDSSQDSQSGQRSNIKSRLGHRLILDLDDTKNKDAVKVGREMANKLFEEKDELLIRVVEILGVDLSVEIYKETQKIEADGGMMINNGIRRRTPGGVFLYLLKNHDQITFENRKAIFDEDRQIVRKSRKEMENVLRDRKVEELKKRLANHEKLPKLNTRSEMLTAKNCNMEAQSENLSNPPPSPVVGQGNSPEYKSQAIINHVTADSCPASTSTTNALKNLQNPIDDLDFLDLNYADMDFV